MLRAATGEVAVIDKSEIPDPVECVGELGKDPVTELFPFFTPPSSSLVVVVVGEEGVTGERGGGSPSLVVTCEIEPDDATGTSISSSS